jgi:hypothetical protein
MILVYSSIQSRNEFNCKYETGVTETITPVFRDIFVWFWNNKLSHTATNRDFQAGDL